MPLAEYTAFIAVRVSPLAGTLLIVPFGYPLSVSIGRMVGTIPPEAFNLQVPANGDRPPQRNEPKVPNV